MPRVGRHLHPKLVWIARCPASFNMFSLSEQTTGRLNPACYLCRNAHSSRPVLPCLACSRASPSRAEPHQRGARGRHAGRTVRPAAALARQGLRVESSLSPGGHGGKSVAGTYVYINAHSEGISCPHGPSSGAYVIWERASGGPGSRTGLLLRLPGVQGVLGVGHVLEGS